MIQRKQENGMGEQLASPITYLVALSFNSDEDNLPAEQPHEPIVMDFDSDCAPIPPI